MLHLVYCGIPLESGDDRYSQVHRHVDPTAQLCAHPADLAFSALQMQGNEWGMAILTVIADALHIRDQAILVFVVDMIAKKGSI